MPPSRRPLNWVQWVSLLTALSVAAVMPFIVVRIQDARRDTNESIRKVLCYFETQTLASPRVSQARKAQTVRAFAAALEQINQPPCQ